MNTINKCNLCGSSNLNHLYTAFNQPIFLGFSAHPPTKNKRERKDIHLYQCVKCGLIQQSAPLPPERLYDSVTASVGGGGYRCLPHQDNQIRLLKTRTSFESCLEIGCSHGEFLRALHEASCKQVVGIEACEESVKYCQQRGMQVEKGLFNITTAQYLEEKYGKFDIVALRHVFEHLPNFSDFFEAVRIVLKKNGFIFIEVPDFLTCNSPIGYCFSSICHEHCSYFTKDTLQRCLEEYNFTITELFQEPLAGGVLTLLAQNTSLYKKIIPVSDDSYIFDFQHQIKRFSMIIHNIIKVFKYRDKPIFMYSACAHGITSMFLFNFENELSAVFDDNLDKHGKYINYTKLRIHKLDEIKNYLKDDNLLFFALHPEYEKNSLKYLYQIAGDKKIYIFPLISTLSPFYLNS